VANVNLIVGNDGSNTLLGTSAQDLIYGFDPNGPQGQVSSITATRVASGLFQPVFAVSPPGDADRLFVVEKTGQIKILDLNTNQVSATPFLDVTSQISSDGEGGLIGLAFDPNYAQNGFFYVNVINTSGDTEIRRFQVSGTDPNQANLSSSTPIIAIDQPDGLTNHKGGWLGFGPDGYLYASLGDGGSGGDNGQNVNVLLGKMLRLDVHADGFPADPSRNYAVPSDNPFVGIAGADEIWALGLRNPWRPSFDRASGDLYIADVGQGTWEEINLGQRGANYGWNVFEGPDIFQNGPLGGGTLTAPIYFYPRDIGHSVTGGYVYRGESEGLQGQYFFADFVSDRFFTLRFNGTSWVATERTSQITPDVGTIDIPSSFGEDGHGNLYVLDFSGEIFKLTPNVSSADQSDVLNGLAGADFLYGGSGNDHLTGGPGADALNGGNGFDYARYDSAGAGVLADLLFAGADTGEAAGDIYISIEGLAGSGFDDVLRGSNNVNDIHGLAGNDFIDGRDGGDYLGGEEGNDHLIGGAGGDVLDGGNGFDYARYDTAGAGVVADLQTLGVNTGDAAGDTYISIEGLVGSGFDDVLRGNDSSNDIHGFAGNDVIDGRGGEDYLGGENGNDHLIGGAGPDGLDGGNGFDYARYDTAGAGVVADVLSAGVNTGDAAGDTYISIEGLVGSGFGDTLRGDNNVNDIHGLGGNDIIDGRGGADAIGGEAGDDVFIFRRGEANGDTLVDFAGNGAAAGDTFQFVGYGTAGAGATFTQLDATHWRINSSDGAVHDTITLSNGASVNASDYLFV
jgi:glucose/arabinose dehydrogenase/Ca2+-binding RTX toxin-like protein